MKKYPWLVALIAATLSLPAPAETPQQQKMKTCNAEATQKTLKGEARKAFMSECLSAKAGAESTTLTPQQEKMKKCNSDAASQALKGDARKAFMKECLSK